MNNTKHAWSEDLQVDVTQTYQQNNSFSACTAQYQMQSDQCESHNSCQRRYRTCFLSTKPNEASDQIRTTVHTRENTISVWDSQFDTLLG